MIFSTGQRAIHLYVMPKYKLEYAWQRKEDMQAVLALAKAQNDQEIRDACKGKGGLYSIKRHMYLRKHFVTVFITDEKWVLDCHRHFVRGAGYSEHSEFIETQNTQYFL